MTARPPERPPVATGESTSAQQTDYQPARHAVLVRTPVSTYRLQLTPQFTVRHLQSVCDYLHGLGISECYCSPVLVAGPGSTHGYDISDHRSLNPELGTRDDLRALARTLRTHDLGLILDFVPNHMGIDPDANAWWRDVLENGQSSPYARYFDIDWNPVKPELRNKVLLPILGDQYGRVLERGELQLEYRSGVLVVRYFERTLPVNPREAPAVLGHRITELAASLGEDDPSVREFRSILTALSNLPATTERDAERISERHREKEIARERLAALTARSSEILAHIQRAIAEFNGRPDDRHSFDQLHGLLEVQAYRLAYWRTAVDEINYRRFFDVNELAGLRMEDPRVFADTHALLLDLIEEGVVTGLRIDHPDGLFDPAAYFGSLRAATSERVSGGRRIYVIAEKVLARGEQLRDDWAVDGTTGYGFLNIVNGVFIPSAGLSDLRRVYRQFTGHRELPADTIYGAKRFIMRSAMASELNVLSRMLNRLSEADRRSRDFTLDSLRRALTEVIACFPVYRAYISERGASIEDTVVVDAALAEAHRRNPVQEPSILEFIRRQLLPPAPTPGAGANPDRDRSVAFAQKFQQYTAPVVAKGLEDTAFYRDVKLLSANEVGSDLRHRCRTVGEFHASSLQRLLRWPYEMTAASTHDTKRGEDARARINVIAECADEWRAQLRQWTAATEMARTRVSGAWAPDRTDEWLFYQSLIGAWPAELVNAPVPTAAPCELVERMQAFMGKAIKEAKRHTSWLHANVEYEDAVARFVQSALAGERAPAFLAAFVPFQRRLAWFGMIGSLAQTVLRLGAPGVPDVYQGAELWNLALVDPDNRHAVNFDERRGLLQELEPLLHTVEASRTDEREILDIRHNLRVLFDEWPDGRAKLYTLAAALRLRRRHPELFLHGDYEPLGGDLDDPHLIAFCRTRGPTSLVVMVPRFVATLLHGTPGSLFGPERWRTASVRLPAHLAGKTLVNIFTGERVEPVIYRDVPWLMAGSAFQSWPVAMLKSIG